MSKTLSRVLHGAIMAFAAACVVSSAYAANDWVNFATVSMTDAVTAKLADGYGCYTDGKDILCDSKTSAITFGTGGLIDMGGLTVAGSVSAAAVSATYVSATVVQINGSTMPCGSGLGGTIRYNAGNIEYCNGVGPGWQPLANSSAVQGDRIVSGTTSVIASNGASITVTVANTQSAMFGNDSSLRVGPSNAQRLWIRGTGIDSYWQDNTGIPLQVGIGNGSNNAIVQIAATNNSRVLLANSFNARVIVGQGNYVDGSGAKFNISENAESNYRTASYVSNTGLLDIGVPSSTNIVFDSSTILARNAGAGSPLFIQSANSAGNGNTILNKYSGNVGISNTNPIAKLDVWGSISASDAIQVGQSNYNCINSISGSIRYNSTSDTLQVCTGAGWASLSSGTAVSALANLSDVSVTNPGTGAYLVYNGSKWTTIGSSQTMSTTTMVPNFPDAIQCHDTVGTNIYYMANAPYQDGHYWYVKPYNGGDYGGFGYNSDGTFYQKFGNTTDAADCQISISGIMAAGRSYNFIGGAGAVSGAGSATAIAFWNGTSSLTYESATTSGLYWDHSNGRLGVGTNSPSQVLEVAGSAKISSTIQFPLGVAVGLGTIPQSLSTVAIGHNAVAYGDNGIAIGENAVVQTGTYRSVAMGTSATANQRAQFAYSGAEQASGYGVRFTLQGFSSTNTSRNMGDVVAHWVDSTDATRQARLGLGAYTSSSTLTEGLSVLANGNVGVGMITPTATLQVSGTFAVSTSSQAATAPSLYVASNGSVGIGTSAPSYALEVSSSGGERLTSPFPWIVFNETDTGISWTLVQDGGAIGFRYGSTGNVPVFALNSSSAVIGGYAATAAGSSLTIIGGEAQVGSSGAACVSAVNGGAIRYLGGTLYYCNGANTWTTIGSGGGTLSGGGSATAVAFWNGPSSLTYESATTSGLYWDHINGRLGVGTNSPSDIVTISGTTSANGYVWMKSTSTTTGGVVVDTGAANNYKGLYLQYIGAGASAGNGRNDTAELGSNNTDITIRPNVEAVRFKQDGRVGIGTQSPTATLQVSGTFTVSQTGQNSLASASLAVDSRGVSVSSIIHLGSNAVVPIGAGGNAILSGTTVVSTSSAGSITMYAGGAERLGLDGVTGFVGIGTITPSRQLDVNGAINFKAGLYSTSLSSFYVADNIGTGYPGINFNGGDFIDYRRDVDAMRFSTANNVRLTIDSSGDIGVGTTNPAAGSPNPGIVLYPGGVMHIGNNAGANGFGFVNFYRSGTFIGNISQNGTAAVLYNQTSDRRIKENIADTRAGLQRLMQIGVKDFSFKADPSHTIMSGFIAQDLNKVYPEAVTTNGDNGEVPLKDKAKPWSVDYGRVTPLIVKAVQDLKHLVDTDTAGTQAQLKAANDNIQTLGRQVEALQQEVRQLRQQAK